jgi:hypothetical protein
MSIFLYRRGERKFITFLRLCFTAACLHTVIVGWIWLLFEVGWWNANIQQKRDDQIVKRVTEAVQPSQPSTPATAAQNGCAKRLGLLPEGQQWPAEALVNTAREREGRFAQPASLLDEKVKYLPKIPVATKPTPPVITQRFTHEDGSYVAYKSSMN